MAAEASPGARAAAPDPPVTAWERRTEWPLTVLAVLFFGAYAWRVLDTGLSPGGRSALDLFMWVAWAVYAVDYFGRLAISRQRWQFVRRHLFDLAVLLLPMFRQLRVLRLVTVLIALNRRVPSNLRTNVGVYVTGATALVGVSASLAALDAERGHAGATITTFPDALWWTLATITTVGYGDTYPVTWQGRLVAAGLMLAGIALLGVITGSIASWFVERFRGVEASLASTSQAVDESTRVELTAHAELRALRAELAELREQLSARSG
ncbi:ion transporter [Longimycelium tulufanense]|uniref:Ion transporter n=1 Tax=Longimycelium tulufanense TaxID=907463 RepID=A0A8J3CFV1_9PSEU|nr:potassium channel family protein [Longimycelium tulufanense]GGM69225.1 ion transporter [Longimycelium tulufanense]